MRSYLLRICLLAGVSAGHSSVAQVPTPMPAFNPGLIWSKRLEPVGEVLYLSARQRGLQQLTTYLLYAGQRYLMQELHYDPQGRLQTSKDYRLDLVAGHLVRQLVSAATYHTQLLGDSLVSEVEQRWRLPADTVFNITTWQFSGSLPPTEPLFGSENQAHQLLRPAAGRLRATQLGKPGATYEWNWSPERSYNTGPFALYQREPPYFPSDGYIRFEEQPRCLKAAVRNNQFTLNWDRCYAGRWQHYRENCSVEYVSGPAGASTSHFVYRRTARWRSGQCRTERFTALDESLPNGRHPEFGVRHYYTFYPTH